MQSETEKGVHFQFFFFKHVNTNRTGTVSLSMDIPQRFMQTIHFYRLRCISKKKGRNIPMSGTLSNKLRILLRYWELIRKICMIWWAVQHTNVFMINSNTHDHMSRKPFSYIIWAFISGKYSNKPIKAGKFDSFSSLFLRIKKNGSEFSHRVVNVGNYLMNKLNSSIS